MTPQSCSKGEHMCGIHQSRLCIVLMIPQVRRLSLVEIPRNQDLIAVWSGCLSMKCPTEHKHPITILRSLRRERSCTDRQRSGVRLLKIHTRSACRKRLHRRRPYSTTPVSPTKASGCSKAGYECSSELHQACCAGSLQSDDRPELNGTAHSGPS